MALGALTAIAALLAACQDEPPAAEPESKAVRRPPEPACDQARAELARKERGGTFLFEESGEAMTDRRSWMNLRDAGRDEIIRTLAVVAACAAELPMREVEVTIRDEGGVVLKSVLVEPSSDFRAR
jgi:hypothetical protein